MAKKKQKIPEKKLIELLAKHLKTTHLTAENIVKEIKEKLIPYAKVIDLEQQEREVQAQRQKKELEGKIKTLEEENEEENDDDAIEQQRDENELRAVSEAHQRLDDDIGQAVQ